MNLQRISKRWARIQVPKAGWLKYRLTYRWYRFKIATSARVTLEGGRWHVALITPERGKINTHATANPIGIDCSITNTLVTSDSEFFQIPTVTVGEQQRFLAPQRQLSLHRKGARRREMTRSKLRELHRRLADRRRDWIEQTTTELALRHRSVAVEKLPVANMVRQPKPKPDLDNPGGFLPNGAKGKAKLNAAISGSCWGKFATRLADKTDVIEVPAKGTSIDCRRCGHSDKRNRESQAVFRCQRCGHTGHADVLDAMTVHDRGFGPPNNKGRRTGSVRASGPPEANHLAA